MDSGSEADKLCDLHVSDVDSDDSEYGPYFFASREMPPGKQLVPPDPNGQRQNGGWSQGHWGHALGMRHSPPQSVCIFKLTGSLPLRALYTFAGYTRKEAEFFQRNGSAGQLVGEVNFPNNGLARRSQPHSKATTSYKAVYDPQAP